MSFNTRPVMGTGDNEKTTGWFFTWWHEYSSFLPGRNWHNFTFIHFHFEYAPYMGHIEVEMALLGFNLMVQYVYDDTERKRMKQLADDISSGKEPTMSFSELVERLNQDKDDAETV